MITQLFFSRKKSLTWKFCISDPLIKKSSRFFSFHFKNDSLQIEYQNYLNKAYSAEYMFLLKWLTLAFYLCFSTQKNDRVLFLDDYLKEEKEINHFFGTYSQLARESQLCVISVARNGNKGPFHIAKTILENDSILFFNSTKS